MYTMIERNLDGTGVKHCRCYAMPAVDEHRYWEAVTDVLCPACGAGMIRWAEAGYVPGYRICDGCGRHFLAEGTAAEPRLIRMGDRREPAGAHKKYPAGTCAEIVEDASSPMKFRPCGQSAPAVVLACPAGRPDARACYCADHGGLERADREAHADWNYLAPASVGGPADVQEAGCATLCSEHAYIQVQRSGGGWLAWLGLGSHMIPVSPAHPLPNAPMRRAMARGATEEEAMARAKKSGRPPARFATREAAIEEASAAWRAAVESRVAEICELRGGTLTWGMPVTPATAPHLVEGPNAWDSL